MSQKWLAFNSKFKSRDRFYEGLNTGKLIFSNEIK